MAALDAGPTVAIFPWGEVIEQFLDSLGLDLDGFVNKMTGGWLFGYRYLSVEVEAGGSTEITLSGPAIGYGFSF